MSKEVESEESICKKISFHVYNCKKCQRNFGFDPIDKSIMKTISITSELIELFTYIITGVVLILILS